MTVDIDLKKHIDDSYKIHIDALPTLTFAKKTAVVTNTTVSELHLAYLLERLEAPSVEVVTLPDGEQRSKSGEEGHAGRWAGFGSMDGRP